MKTLFSGPLNLSRFVVCTSLHALNINVIAIQLGAVFTTQACFIYLGEFSSKGCGDFNEGSSHQRGVWFLGEFSSKGCGDFN